MKYLIILMLFVISIHGQNFQWAKKSGGVSDDWSNHVTSDIHGNAYITGKFKGPAQFETQTLHSTGIYDFYVAKYNAAGSLLWVKQAGSTSVYGKIEGSSVCVNSLGDVFVTGFYDSTINFGNGFFVSAEGHAYDMFVVKYNNTGMIQWVISCGGNSQDYANDIIADANGNTYITGQNYGPAQFGSFFIPTSGGFTAKINSTGIFQWVKGGNFASYAIAFDNSGNPVITGTFSNTVSFGNITFSANGKAAFAVKYNVNGNEISGIQSSGSIDGIFPMDISILITNEIYICGFYYQNIQFGSTNLVSAGNEDCFIANINPSMNWDWAKSGGGLESDVFDGISIAPNEKLYVTGSFRSNANFSGINLINTGQNHDIVLASYEPDGDILWAISAGTSSGRGMGVSAENPGFVYFTGYFSGSLSLPGGVTIISNGANDNYLAKMDSSFISVIGLGNSFPEKYNLSQNYPNPFNPSTTINFDLLVAGFITLKVYDVLGREIAVLINSIQQAGKHNVSWDASSFPSGVYFYKLIVRQAGSSTGEYTAAKKMILIK